MSMLPEETSDNEVSKLKWRYELKIDAGFHIISYPIGGES